MIAQYKFHVLDNMIAFYKPMEGFLSGGYESKGPVEGVEDADLAPAFSTGTEKLIASDTLVPQTEEESVQNWSRMTSERCYRSDVGESLKMGGTYLQRTNNYVRSHPDSCSAPNHEFVGTFYKPHEGIGATLPSGM
jgi:hypothetical protein